MTTSQFSKYSFLPIEHPSLDFYYQQQKNVVWFPSHVSLEQDIKDWKRQDIRNQKKFLFKYMCLFSQLDALINENIVEHFKQETSEYKDARNFYAAQNFIETIHAEMYSIFIDKLIDDESLKAKMFDSISHDTSIKNIADWVLKWMNKSLPLEHRVIAFACIEGILFSAAFAGVYWLKSQNIFPGVCKANEWIARDECLHTLFAVELYKVMNKTVDKHIISSIIKESVELAIDFNKEALETDGIGLTTDGMNNYIKCTADVISNYFGSGILYGESAGPFTEWMKIIGLSNKSNFFETTVTEYSAHKSSDFKFDLDTEF